MFGADRAWRDAVAGADRRRVVLGHIRGPHGVRGWVKVQTFTEERETLLQHPLWLVGRGEEFREYRLKSGQGHGSGLLVSLEGVSGRDEAEALRGKDVAVWRDALPALEENEFYWSDLEGLEVVTRDGIRLGVVERLFETGANDVMVVAGDRERLIPFVMDEVVLRVDLAARCLEVDWDPEF
jgi:16S rRNA processing protein RimM